MSPTSLTSSTDYIGGFASNDQNTVTIYTQADALVMELRAWRQPVLRPLLPLPTPPLIPPAARARHGFQQMCRLPCYRGARTR